VEALVILEEPL